MARFKDIVSTEDAHVDFKKVQTAWCPKLPNMLLQKGDEFIWLGGGVMTTEKIEARIS